MGENSNIPEELLRLMEEHAGLGLPELTDLDMAGYLLDRLDYEKQLVAIEDLLRRNGEAEARVAERLRQLDNEARRSTGWRNERAIDEFGECFYISVYQDAAHSMAAVGMLAPFFESLFFQAFHGVREKYGIRVVAQNHVRMAALGGSQDFWDCHVWFDETKRRREKHLVPGILQLADAVGLATDLPGELRPTLEALFDYRNRMFHNGFEWTSAECSSFAARIGRNGWQDWFSDAKHGDEPWIFYLTEPFISRCLILIHSVLSSLGAYCKHRAR